MDLLTHPSKTLLGEELPCDDCDVDDNADLDDDDLEEIRNEARLRLLKAEKVSAIILLTVRSTLKESVQVPLLSTNITTLHTDGVLEAV